MISDIYNITRHTVVKYDTCHTSYYPVNITMRGFKEATHRKVDMCRDMAPYTPNGTTPDMPRPILMNSMGKSRQRGPAPITNPTSKDGRRGLPKVKVRNLPAAKARAQHIQHSTHCVSPKEHKSKLPPPGDSLPFGGHGAI